ncbi:hypothetical protein, partial [Burkholderia cenocepacia]|uniref:hypothetical protein n=1 Tax=Burkholderia cenocepacia TaxID=95486 RepID=UPI001ABA5852
IAAAYCSRRAHPIASRSSAVNNLHYGTARALTVGTTSGVMSHVMRSKPSLGVVAADAAIFGSACALSVADTASSAPNTVLSLFMFLFPVGGKRDRDEQRRLRWRCSRTNLQSLYYQGTSRRVDASV